MPTPPQIETFDGFRPCFWPKGRPYLVLPRGKCPGHCSALVRVHSFPMQRHMGPAVLRDAIEDAPQLPAALVLLRFDLKVQYAGRKCTGAYVRACNTRVRVLLRSFTRNSSRGCLMPRTGRQPSSVYHQPPSADGRTPSGNCQITVTYRTNPNILRDPTFFLRRPHQL